MAKKKTKPRGRDVVPGLGPALKRRRQELGYTLREVAEAAGTHAINLSQIEREARSVSARLLFEICDALDITVDTIRSQLTGTSPTTPKKRD